MLNANAAGSVILNILCTLAEEGQLALSNPFHQRETPFALLASSTKLSGSLFADAKHFIPTEQSFDQDEN